MEARITERDCSAITDVQLPRDNPEAVQSGDQRNWRTWSWKDGKIGHAVPRGWEFPARTNVKVLWNMWHFGDQDTGIRPYRLLSEQHDIMPQHRMRHTRARTVMEYLENLALGAQLLPAGLIRISKLQIPMADKVFDIVFAAALSQLYSEAPKRAEDLSCGTLYNRLCQYRKNSRNK
ncbi:hypothetical protein P3T76_008772 [Phytophthora citrophthora]|uniref:Uncharacterized protein n=1 Tax=Phytophthora citrophthora TaxID=4793 RepID=A0AAD9GJ93_9STRA|nr:hypothetical protein P3T76_008772 [Phytophthora citrophthora]